MFTIDNREELKDSKCLERLRLALGGAGGVLYGFDCMVRLVADAIRSVEGNSTRKEWAQAFYSELKGELKYENDFPII